MDSGELCVMMGLVGLMPILFVDSWDTTEHTDMIISQCELSVNVQQFFINYMFHYHYVVVETPVNLSG